MKTLILISLTLSLSAPQPLSAQFLSSSLAPQPFGSSAPQPLSPSAPQPLSLRGGFGNWQQLSSPKGNVPTGGTTIKWRKINDLKPTRLEVTGSWSQFATRHPMTKTQNGDWEVAIEIPEGQHQFKFVVDNNNWRCHPQLDKKTDAQGIENNVISVSAPKQPSVPRQAPVKEEPPAPKIVETYSRRADVIALVRDNVVALEEENKVCQEKLKGAYSQLVETLKGEVSEGLNALDKGVTHVNGFTVRANQGVANLKMNASEKIGEIREHITKIKEILVEKEGVANDAVAGNMNQRIEILEGEIAEFKKLSPIIQQLIDESSSTAKTASTNPNEFVIKTQKLLPEIHQTTAMAAALHPPTDDANFEHLQLNLLASAGRA